MVIAEKSWEQKISDIIEFGVDTIVMGDDWQGKFDYLERYANVIYLPRPPEISTTSIKNYILHSKRQRFGGGAK